MATTERTADASEAPVDPPVPAEGMFPIASLDATVGMISDRRREVAAAQARAQIEADLINRLTAEVQVLNSLRQAHGEQPI
jgi:hypothetical protein